jgi:hypothetical protein
MGTRERYAWVVLWRALWGGGEPSPRSRPTAHLRAPQRDHRRSVGTLTGNGSNETECSQHAGKTTLQYDGCSYDDRLESHDDYLRRVPVHGPATACVEVVAYDDSGASTTRGISARGQHSLPSINA